MAEQHADPVTRPGLRIVTGSVTGPVGSGKPPVTAGAVVPMHVFERAGNAISRRAGAAARIAREAWAPCGRTLHSLWCPEPETMAEHRTYVRSAAWVPPELAGKAATAVKWAGILYHILIGHPLIAAMEAAIKTAKNIQVAASRPLRLLMLAAFVSVLALILLNL